MCAWPKTRYARLWHLLTYPLRFGFKWTLVDVRLDAIKRKKFLSVIGVSALWLALLSYVMILCCNYIGDWLGATPTVMGLTLAAVGKTLRFIFACNITNSHKCTPWD